MPDIPEALTRRVGRAICQAKCKHDGVEPCYADTDHRGRPEPWPPEHCDDPGCLALAVAALREMLDPNA